MTRPAIEESDLFHDHVASHLLHPVLVRAAGGAGDLDAPGFKVDEENAHAARRRGPGRPEGFRTNAAYPDSVSLGCADLLRRLLVPCCPPHRQSWWTSVVCTSTTM